MSGLSRPWTWLKNSLVGEPHGRHLTPQGTPHGTPQGTPQGLPHGTPQWLPQGTPQGTPHGTPQGLPHGLPQGTPQGTPQGLPQWLPQGTHKRNSSLRLSQGRHREKQNDRARHRHHSGHARSCDRRCGMSELVERLRSLSRTLPDDDKNTALEAIVEIMRLAAQAKSHDRDVEGFRLVCLALETRLATARNDALEEAAKSDLDVRGCARNLLAVIAAEVSTHSKTPAFRQAVSGMRSALKGGDA